MVQGGSQVGSPSVTAVIVTFNRGDLLRECLQAVLGQTRRPDILVVDNASTDHTRALLAGEFPALEVLALPENQGGAGGFHEGIRHALGRGAEWLWLMDDDTIPRVDALERLLDQAQPDGLPAPSILASQVLWTDGRIHPMNPPGPDVADADHLVRAVHRGLIPLRFGTLVSLLVRSDAVRRHQLPRKEFFMWSDDIDFTARILRREPGYVVPASAVLHKTPTPHTAAHGGRRFFYAVRNGIYLVRGDALRPNEKVQHLLVIAAQVRQFLRLERYAPWALALVAQGVVRGLRDPSSGGGPLKRDSPEQRGVRSAPVRRQ